MILPVDASIKIADSAKMFGSLAAAQIAFENIVATKIIAVKRFFIYNTQSLKIVMVSRDAEGRAWTRAHDAAFEQDVFLPVNAPARCLFFAYFLWASKESMFIKIK